MSKGWRKESARHSLASRGLKTKVLTSKIKRLPTTMKNSKKTFEHPMSGEMIPVRMCKHCRKQMAVSDDMYYCQNQKCTLYDEEQLPLYRDETGKAVIDIPKKYREYIMADR